MTAAEILDGALNFYLLLLVLLLLLFVLLRELKQKQKNQAYVWRNEAHSEQGPHANAPSSPAEGDLEKVLDFVLRNVSRNLAVHCSELEIPGIKHSFNVFRDYFQCNLWLAGGVVEDVSTFFRDGPARVHEVMGEELIVDAAVGLRNITVRYNDYMLDVGRFLFAGSIQASATPVSLRMRVLVRPSFVVELMSLQVENLGPFKLNITGLGLGRSMLPFLETWIHRNYFPYVQDIALQHISQAVKDGFENLSGRIEPKPERILSARYLENAEVKDAMEEYKQRKIDEIKRRTLDDILTESVQVSCECIKKTLLLCGIPVPEAIPLDRYKK